MCYAETLISLRLLPFACKIVNQQSVRLRSNRTCEMSKNCVLLWTRLYQWPQSRGRLLTSFRTKWVQWVNRQKKKWIVTSVFLCYALRNPDFRQPFIPPIRQSLRSAFQNDDTLEGAAHRCVKKRTLQISDSLSATTSLVYIRTGALPQGLQLADFPRKTRRLNEMVYIVPIRITIFFDTRCTTCCFWIETPR